MVNKYKIYKSKLLTKTKTFKQIAEYCDNMQYIDELLPDSYGDSIPTKLARHHNIRNIHSILIIDESSKTVNVYAGNQDKISKSVSDYENLLNSIIRDTNNKLETRFTIADLINDGYKIIESKF